MKREMNLFGFALIVACGTVFFAHAQDVAAPTTTTMSGVFTQAQIDEGMQVYRVNCSEGCHNYYLEGYGRTKPLIGDSFKEHWRGKNLAEFFQFISIKMPQDLPATLTPNEYVTVMAYVLSQNGFPAGTKALTDDPTALAAIVFADE